MKKLLIASTALVATAGFASADIALDGTASMGVKYDSVVAAGASNTTIHQEVDFGISGSGTTDGGLTFGASLDVDDSSTGGGSGVSDSEVFVSGAFGTLTLGNVDVATDGNGVSDLGFDDIGVDDAGEFGKNQGAADIHFKTTFSDLTVIVSAHSVNNDAAINVAYNFGDFTASLGHSVDNPVVGANTSSTVLTLGGTFGDVSAKAYAGQINAAVDHTGYGVEVGYTMGALGLKAVWSDNTLANQEASYGIGATYDLGGGASLAGAIGSIDGAAANDRETRADFGIKMKF